MNMYKMTLMIFVGLVATTMLASDVMATPQNTGLRGRASVPANSIQGYYLLVEDVPGLTVTWSSATGTVLPSPYTTFRDFGKEQLHRGALRWATPGWKTVVATVSWTGPRAGTYDVTMQVFVY